MKFFESLSHFLKTLRTGREKKHIVLRQRLLLLGGGAIVGLVFIALMGVFERGGEDSKSSITDEEAALSSTIVRFEGAGSVVPREEVWAKRMEGHADHIHHETKSLETQLKTMSKKMEFLEEALRKRALSKEISDETPPGVSPQESRSFPSVPPSSSRELNFSKTSGSPLQNGASPFKNIVVIQKQNGSEEGAIVEGKVPAGSRVEGTLLSGLSVSTAVQSMGDPQPVIIRLREDAYLPRGWRAPLKDAVVVGKCHGDLSSERAYCILETLSYVEASGEIVEEKIEGWVFGEDGRYGLRGKVVDRSDSAIRQSFLAGIFSGMANFFQANTSSGVFPVSPFGQTNAMKPSEMLKAGGSKGVGKALDRLAKFAIERAERMSPVIMINPGRSIDIVLKTGFDLKKSLYRKARVLRALHSRKTFAISHAHNQGKKIPVRENLQ